jgi:hypothetical protein
LFDLDLVRIPELKLHKYNSIKYFIISFQGTEVADTKIEKQAEEIEKKSVCS